MASTAADSATTTPTIEETRERFSHDRFATEACGCSVIEASEGHSVCAFDVASVHFNARGAVMGGAIFTLADFALAVASNYSSAAVSVTNTIEFMSAPRGKRLIATCDANKNGRTLGFYTVEVYDELKTPVARMAATCYRIR